MKCKFCGAEISSNLKVCPYCNSEVVEEKPVTNITNNYYGSAAQTTETNTTCPSCGSKSIKFKREELGNTKSKAGKRVYYQTVAICQDCGYTWSPYVQHEKKKHGIWWWILVVLFYPISLSVWFYRTPRLKLNKKIRVAIIAGVWILLALLGILSPDPATTTDVSDVSTSIVATTDGANVSGTVTATP